MHKLKYKKPKNISRRTSALFFAVVIGSSMFFAGQTTEVSNALTASELRNQAASLQQAINENNAKAKELSTQADSLKRTVDDLNIQINQATAQIELIDVKLAQLQVELDKAQEELERQKGLLKASMRTLYKRGGVSTVELLVGSDSFSEFINDQEYLERLKVGIQDSTEKVIELKQQIQAQQDEQKSLKLQQEGQRTILQENRSKQASLLAETQGQEARYRERTRDLITQQKEINRQLLLQSRVVVGSGSGGYPYVSAVCAVTGQVNGDCWDYEWIYNGGGRRDPWGYYYRNCTSWAAWRSAYNGKELPSGLGNGGDWGYRAPAFGIARGKEPRVGALASFSTGGYGHVVYVEEVLGGNQIRISEFNFIADGVYSERIISASQPTWYIYP